MNIKRFGFFTLLHIFFFTTVTPKRQKANVIICSFANIVMLYTPE